MGLRSAWEWAKDVVHHPQREPGRRAVRLAMGTGFGGTVIGVTATAANALYIGAANVAQKIDMLPEPVKEWLRDPELSPKFIFGLAGTTMVLLGLQATKQDNAYIRGEIDYNGDKIKAAPGQDSPS